jgi:hypothetical protein
VLREREYNGRKMLHPTMPCRQIFLSVDLLGVQSGESIVIETSLRP